VGKEGEIGPGDFLQGVGGIDGAAGHHAIMSSHDEAGQIQGMGAGTEFTALQRGSGQRGEEVFDELIM